MTFGNAIVLSWLWLLLALTGSDRPALADDSKEKAAAVKEEDGKYFDADGNPTFKIQDDGTVDWYTFSGYRRYHSDCHVCHGPDGVGSSYAPALADSLKTIDYGTSCRSSRRAARMSAAARKTSCRPSATTRTSIATWTISTSICARAPSAQLPRGRPPKKDDKPQAAKDAEASCMGG